MKRTTLVTRIVCAFALLLHLGCTQDGDGPMASWDSGKEYQGQGFYLSGSLDSGRRVHAFSDSLPVRLDSLWLISKCYLKDISPITESQDSRVYLGFRLWLNTDPSILCPASPLGSDTILVLPPQDSWKNADRLYLLGAVDSLAVDDDSIERSDPLTDSERFGSSIDSIWLLDGENVDSTFEFSFDSLFSDRSKLPRFVGKGPYIVRFLHPPMEGMNFWNLVPEKCKAPRNTCSIEPDTVWRDLSFNDTTQSAEFFDTNTVSIRARCQGDSTSVNYCSNKDWVRDSSKAIVSGSGRDTLWTWNTFFVERIPRCAVLNRDSLYSYLTGYAGGSVQFWRELFVPSESESRCGIPWNLKVDSLETVVEFEGSILENWLVYSLDSRSIVLDSDLADSIVSVLEP